MRGAQLGMLCVVFVCTSRKGLLNMRSLVEAVCLQHVCDKTRKHSRSSDVRTDDAESFRPRVLKTPRPSDTKNEDGRSFSGQV